MSTQVSKLAVLFDAPRGKFQIDEKPVPDPAPGKCVIKTELTGICATDVHYWMGMGPTSPFPIPAMLGHEFCGTIHALGDGLDKDRLGNTLKVGDRVMVKPTLSCGECIWCTYYNDPTNCLHGAVYGASDYKDPWIHGGYSQYMYLFYPGSDIYKTELPPEAACMFEPFSIGVNAVMNSSQKIGDTVVVQGAGPIGMLTMAAAKFFGAGKCIMVGGPEERLELAKEFGADITLNINEAKDPNDRIKFIKENSLYGLGVDRVYECAGVPGAVSEAIQFLRTGGELVEVGDRKSVV
jgi:threonine dehydrogenase-like Zn-dependent dehydrogenase